MYSKSLSIPEKRMTFEMYINLKQQTKTPTKSIDPRHVMDLSINPCQALPMQLLEDLVNLPLPKDWSLGFKTREDSHLQKG